MIILSLLLSIAFAKPDELPAHRLAVSDGGKLSLPQISFAVLGNTRPTAPFLDKTRAGEGTKIILTGDPYQIDNPYVDSTSNGLTYVVERFKDSPVAGHVTLRKGERSQLAELAATLL